MDLTAPFVAFGLLVIASFPGAAAGELQGEIVGRFVAEARDASTWPQRYPLLGRILDALDQRQRQEFAERAMRDNENARSVGLVVATYASPRDPRGIDPSLWKRAVVDPSPELRRLGWLYALSRSGLITEEQHRALLESPDPYIRAGAAVTEIRPDRLVARVHDESILVRAVVARRLGALAGKTPGLAVQSGLDVLLVDSNEFVRVNAIWGCHGARYFPASTLRGVIPDARPVVEIEELFNDEPEAGDLRVRFGLPRNLHGAMNQLSLLILHHRLIFPAPTLPEIGPQVVGQRLGVGTLAAATLIAADSRDATASIRLLMATPGLGPELRDQLANVLEQAERRKKP